jgi:hypothetical protein
MRQALGLTRTAVAYRAGLREGHLKRLETGGFPSGTEALFVARVQPILDGERQRQADAELARLDRARLRDTRRLERAHARREERIANLWPRLAMERAAVWQQPIGAYR